MYILSGKLSFPPVESADNEGFLAIGGDLSPERLLLAYKSGIFPWYNEDEPICWWSPDPRCVLFPSNLHVSKSMKQVMKSGQYRFSVNQSFENVMRACGDVKRKEGPGTWIQEEMIEAYCRLFHLGHAFSAEAWHEGKLVGGLYGVRIGKVFFGESMFSIMPNASKFAFIRFIQQLQEEGVEIVDCQLRTSHLVSLGATMIPRKKFIETINGLT